MHISTTDTISYGKIKIKSRLINNKDIDIAISRNKDIKSIPKVGQYFWFANIIFLENNQNKYIPLYDFFTLFITSDSYIILKPGEFRDVDFIIDLSGLGDVEFPTADYLIEMEGVHNYDYGEYKITISYYDNYRAHPDAINGKVLSNPIKVLYQKE